MGSDGLAVVGVGDLDPLATVRRSLARVAVPILVDGDDLVAVGVVVSASTGVATLVEEGGETASLDVTATATARVAVGGTRVVVVAGLSGLGSFGAGHGRGGSLELRGGVVVRNRPGRAGKLGRDRGDGSGAGSALGRSRVEALASEERVAARVEEGLAVVVLAVESEVSGVV